MKKYIHIILAVIILILGILIAYLFFGKQKNNDNLIEPTEVPHEHVYTEVITTEATCTENGLKTFTCECGENYTEVITATGHNFGEYIYNQDATYEKDGTMTATCNVCGATDTQTALGSMDYELYLKTIQSLEEEQNENPQDALAKLLAEDLDISVEEAKAILDNEGNGGGDSTSENASSNSNSSGANQGETMRAPMDGGDGGDLVTDGQLNSSSSSGGTMEFGQSGLDSNGGELVTDGYLNP